MSETTLREKVNFLIQVGTALHNFGTNAPRLESAMKQISLAIDLRGNFFSTPTYISVSINSGERQISRNVRVSPGVVNLSKLSDLDVIAGRVCRNELPIKEAVKLIKEVENARPHYNNYALVLAFASISSTLALIFGGSVLELLASFFIGSTVGLWAMIAAKNEKIAESFNLLASFTCTLLTYVLKIYYPQISFQIIVMTSLIAIIPGLNLTIAMSELSAQHLVAGTARFMGTIIDFFKLSFGVLLGNQIGLILFGGFSSYTPVPLSPIFIIPAMALASIAFTIIFNAKLKDFKWIFLSGVVSLTSLKFSSAYFAPTLALFLSGFVVGSGSNLFARLKDRPAMLPLLPGIIFLVPGSVGFEGLNLMFQDNGLEGLGTAFKMLVLAITLVAGLFVANIVVNPRRSL